MKLMVEDDNDQCTGRLLVGSTSVRRDAGDTCEFVVWCLDEERNERKWLRSPSGAATLDANARVYNEDQIANLSPSIDPSLEPLPQ